MNPWTWRMRGAGLTGLALAAAVVAARAVGAAPWTAGAGKVAVDVGVTDVVVSVDGNAVVRLVRTKSELGIADLKVEGAAGDPVSVRRDGGTMTVALDGKRNFLGLKVRTLSADFTLLVPEGKAVRLSAGKLALSGEASARSFRLAAGSLTASALALDLAEGLDVAAGKAVLDVAVTRAKDVRIATGSVSGRMRVPESAQIKNVSGNSTLTLLLKEGA